MAGTNSTLPAPLTPSSAPLSSPTPVPNTSVVTAATMSGSKPPGTPQITVITMLPPNVSTVRLTITTRFDPSSPQATNSPVQTEITKYTVTHVTATLPPIIVTETSSSASTTTTGTLNTGASSGSSVPFSRNTGAILGVAFGGTVAVVFIALWIVLSRRTRKKRKSVGPYGVRIANYGHRTSHGPVDGDDDLIINGGGGVRTSERFDGLLTAVQEEGESRAGSYVDLRPRTVYPGGFDLAGPSTSTSPRSSPSSGANAHGPPPGGTPERESIAAGGYGTASPSDPSSSREDVAAASHVYGGEWGDSGDSSDRIGIAVPYRPPTSSTPETYKPAEPATSEPRKTTPPLPTVPPPPPSSYTFHPKRASGDSTRSVKGLFGRLRKRNSGSGPSEASNSNDHHTPRTSMESGQRADSSRAPSRQQQRQHSSASFPAMLLPQAFRPTPPQPPHPPPLYPLPPVPWTAGGDYPPPPPSPAGTDGSRDRLEGLLDPRLVLRLAESGQRSLTSFADHEDYTRRIAAAASTATVDSPSHENTTSDHESVPHEEPRTL